MTFVICDVFALWFWFSKVLFFFRALFEMEKGDVYGFFVAISWPSCWTFSTPSHPREVFGKMPLRPLWDPHSKVRVASLPTWEKIDFGLEAQQRYFSYRAILVAIVSQNVFVLVFMGYRTIVARYAAKWGITVTQMCLCQTKYQGGVSHHFGGVQPSLKRYRAIWGIAAIVSQYRAIWGH